jgi:hypothetical protein
MVKGYMVLFYLLITIAWTWRLLYKNREKLHRSKIKGFIINLYTDIDVRSSASITGVYYF